jgi:hypothetical protein
MVRTQSNHIFSAIYAYVKLEKAKLERKINHFALKLLIWAYPEFCVNKKAGPFSST